MSKTLLDLAHFLEYKANAISREASDTSKRVALAIVQNLTAVTPVDTSTALSNWHVSLHFPVDITIPPHSFGHLGSTKAQSAGQTIGEARNVLSNKRPGDKLYISNNVDYIQKLNEGSSKQEPAGFVERAIIVGRLKGKSFKLGN